VPGANTFKTEWHALFNNKIVYVCYDADKTKTINKVRRPGAGPAGTMKVLKSLKNIVKEIELLRDEYNIDFISFVDDNMLANKKRTIEFCKLMQNSGLKWACLARVDNITEEYVKHLKAGGCVGLGFGLESGSPKILKNMNKKHQLIQISGHGVY